MSKAKHKKESEFQTQMTKSVFLYGRPNKEKAEALRKSESLYLRDVRRFVEEINGESSLFRSLVLGDNRSPEARAYEKAHRAKDVSATFSQAAFDDAFVKIANRMDTIRKEVMAFESGCLVKSKVLFGLVLTGASKEEMFDGIEEAASSYKRRPKRFDEWKEELTAMDDTTFRFTCTVIQDMYESFCLEYKVPEVKRCDVRLVATNFRFTLTNNIKAGAVIEISLPGQKGYITVPLELSGDAKRRLMQYGACHSAAYAMREDGLLCVAIAFKKKLKEPKTERTNGVDIGIKDALHVSSTGAIGSLMEVIDYYKKEVEPLFAEKTKLINKKRKLIRYLRRHKDVPEGVKADIRKKIDRLEEMIRSVKKAYRKNRRYHDLLKKKIKDVVAEYIRSLYDNKHVLTVLELLDIKEFNKSRKANGMMSIFARGLLSKTLMETLNWKGYAFKQIDPAYTSQECPVCHHTEPANRNGKSFVCKCCGHKDDADHVGSVNIGSRADDIELEALCEEFCYNKKARHAAILSLLNERNKAWVKMRAGGAAA